ncbi:unnamed protein product [Eruca vesicaria subsp. sativa]|uniref:Uncharacterized protein n=1 Tax=Eruca vesicaria subsp. sativa TaxID=29727 RepID=A0ABC8KIE4_ERUVS|nr:unnamed protein product [Eruca vesicaria subsp. sativa]
MWKDLVVEGDLGEMRCLLKLGKRNGLTESGVTYPGGAEQLCHILWSPHTGKRNPETLSECIESKRVYDAIINSSFPVLS